MSGDVADRQDVTAIKPEVADRGAATFSSHRASSFERIGADGERYVPHRFRDGMYRVADPALGRTKHHAANQIAITAGEIGDYLRKGYLLRMRGEINGQVNLIAASEIKAISHSEATTDQLSGSHGVDL